MGNSDNSIIKNRKAYHSYEILDKIEAGIVLVGTEVKSLRQGKVQLADAYAFVRHGEVFLQNMHIPHYSHGNVYNHDETRERKLLLHRREIDRLNGQIKQKNLTLIPLSLYWKNNKVKVELGLGRGKKQFDKRDDVKKRESDRELRRAAKAF